MDLIPLEFSLVVAGQDCNPSILNPDFLERHEIVPEAWGWQVKGDLVTTPHFSAVPYDSRVTVTVERKRFQVAERSPSPGAVVDEKVVELAKAYVNKLPHVRYTAVGVNFKCIYERNAPDDFIVEHFIKQGPWNGEERSPQAVGLKLAYPVEGAMLNLNYSGGEALLPRDGGTDKKQGVIVGANFHRDCQRYPGVQEVVEHLERARGDWTTFDSITEEIFE